MTAYYNEFDPFAAAWLRNLIKAGHVADGEVDERSIADVAADDLLGFTQCHFFAGIGGWAYALRLAGWPDDRPVWTGSCPCQPFSVAGKGKGVEDERHLWPEFRRLISECAPPVVFGEQVASKDGLGWLDLVRADMEAAGYALAAVDLCAAGIGAPHIRQRLWFVGLADADGGDARAERQQRQQPEDGGAGGRGDGLGARLEGHAGDGDGAGGRPVEAGPASSSGRAGGVADNLDDGRREHRHGVDGAPREGQGAAGERQRFRPDPADGGAAGRPGPTNGYWRDADWLFCRDGRWRPVEPGTSPLAHGVPGRVGRLRGYGNAIVPQVAAEVIAAFMECAP